MADGTSHKRMSCLEVWGGNQAATSSVEMAGLDAWVYSRPYGDSTEGGDVYYVSSCATGRVTRLLVADVSGHGEQVSRIAADLRAMMRRYVNFLDQRQFVGAMNARFTESAQLGTFATALATTFFGPTRNLAICNAGHPPPLIYRAKEGEWSFLEQGAGAARGAHNYPLGVMDLASYEQFSVRLNVGDLVLCYTDSLIESHGPAGEMLGKEGLLEIVRNCELGAAETFVQRLLDRIRSTAPGNLTEDDVTVLLFRPNGQRERGFVERMAGVLKMGRELISSWGGRRAPFPWPEWSLPNIGGAFFSGLSRLWRPAEVSEKK